MAVQASLRAGFPRQRRLVRWARQYVCVASMSWSHCRPPRVAGCHTALAVRGGGVAIGQRADGPLLFDLAVDPGHALIARRSLQRVDGAFRRQQVREGVRGELRLQHQFAVIRNGLEEPALLRVMDGADAAVSLGPGRCLRPFPQSLGARQGGEVQTRRTRCAAADHMTGGIQRVHRLRGQHADVHHVAVGPQASVVAVEEIVADDQVDLSGHGTEVREILISERVKGYLPPEFLSRHVGGVLSFHHQEADDVDIPTLGQAPALYPRIVHIQHSHRAGRSWEQPPYRRRAINGRVAIPVGVHDARVRRHNRSPRLQVLRAGISAVTSSVRTHRVRHIEGESPSPQIQRA